MDRQISPAALYQITMLFLLKLATLQDVAKNAKVGRSKTCDAGECRALALLETCIFSNILAHEERKHMKDKD